MAYLDPVKDIYESFKIEEKNSESLYDFLENDFDFMDNESRLSLLNDPRFVRKIFLHPGTQPFLTLLETLSEKEKLIFYKSEMFINELKDCVEKNVPVTSRVGSMVRFYAPTSQKDLFASPEYDFLHSVPSFWDGFRRMESSKKTSLLLRSINNGDKIVFRPFIDGYDPEYLCGDSLVEKSIREYIIMDHQVFTGSKWFIEKALPEMKASDLNEEDYIGFCRYLESSFADVPRNFFNEKFYKVFNNLTDPVAVGRIIYNVHCTDPLAAERLQYHRIEHIKNLEPKTLNSVCELYFQDSPRDVYTNVWSILKHAKTDHKYAEMLGNFNVAFYERMLTLLQGDERYHDAKDGDLDGNALYEFLNAFDFDYMDKYYQDIRDGKNFAARDLLSNLTNLEECDCKKTEVDGVKVHSFTGENFALLVHQNGRAKHCSMEHISEHLKVDESHPWTMSTSLICERTISTFVSSGPGDFFYGFYNLTPEAIDNMSTGDGYTYNHESEKECKKDGRPVNIYKGNSSFAPALHDFETFKKESTNRMNEITVKTNTAGHGRYIKPDFFVIYKNSDENVADVIPDNVLATAKRLGIDIVTVDIDTYQEKIRNLDNDKSSDSYYREVPHYSIDWD